LCELCPEGTIFSLAATRGKNRIVDQRVIPLTRAWDRPPAARSLFVEFARKIIEVP
jgi:hypothetical protein